MQSRGVHNPAAQNRAICAERVQTGCDFSPLVDAFHPSFPVSIEAYISVPCERNRGDRTHVRPNDISICQDACPLTHNDRPRMNSASSDGDSTEIASASAGLHYNAEGHRDDLLPGTSDPIFILPSEVSDLILSYLSPAELDAVRHACKCWRRKILSNTWVLSSVLGIREGTPSPLDTSLIGTTSHRNLLKKLDCYSALPSTFQHPEAWRTRFRTRTLDFSIPLPSSALRRPVFVAAARTGTQNGLFVFQLQVSAKDIGDRSSSALVIYRFDSTELPWYAGVVHEVEGQGALRIINVIEVRRHAEWILRIDIGDTPGLYSLTAREAFSNAGSRFSLNALESLDNVPGLSQDNSASRDPERPPEAIPMIDQSWNILAPFPPNGGLRHVCFSEGLRKHTEPCFLAEQTETGSIHVIMEVGPSEKQSQCANYSQSNTLLNHSESGNHIFTSLALLSRPRSDSVWKNVAAAPSITKDGSTRAAIVWQTADLEKPISELYIYDIPEAMYYEPCRAYSQNIFDNASATAKDLSEGAVLRPCRLVHGKRVTSLDQHMGGTDPSSPLYQLASPQGISIGGIQLPHTSENQEAYPRDVQYQKCFVWGLASSEDGECTQISVKVFDFSFADPQRLHSLTTYGVGAGWPSDKKFQNITLNSLHCACALHDDGFCIVLPDITIVEPPTEREKYANETTASWFQKSATLRENLSSLNATPLSFWRLRTPTSAPDVALNVGSVARNDSVARRAALERRQEWLRGRIRGMKRVGLSDFEIRETWNMSAWTRYGQVRKPEGWQALVREG